MSHGRYFAEHIANARYVELDTDTHVPMFVDATKINAEFKYGVLTVTLPKREEARAKQIDVKVN